jgi:hypothetical protein
MMPQERRLSRRKIPEHLTYIGLPLNNGGIVLDISEGGLGFHSIAPIVADGPIAFRFSVDSAKRVKAVGELAWIDETGRTGGLRFTELPDEIRESIRAWSGPPETIVQEISVAEPVIQAQLASSEGAGVGLATDDSMAEPQLGTAIAISSEFDLAPFVHIPDDELEMESLAAPVTETDLAAAGNLPFIPPEVELEAALAKEADFSPGAARSNPVLYNLEPPVYSSPSYSLSMFPLRPYSTPETNFAPFSRPGTIKHPIAAIALTAVFAFFTAVGIFSYMSTTLLGQLVLSWGGEAMIGLQMPSNPQASTIPANSAPDSTKSAHN